MSTLQFKSANPVDSIRFTAQIGVPNIVGGLIRPRELPTRVATWLGLDAAAYRLMAQLTHKYGPDPFFIQIGRERTLVVHHPDDIRFVLAQSPTSFGSDPSAKRKGMVAFQPDALTISRGGVWAARRRFAEAVLDTGSALHRSAENMLAMAKGEAQILLDREGDLDWRTVNNAFQRLARRVIFGDHAAADGTLSERLEMLMAAGNRLPGRPAEGYYPLVESISDHLSAAEQGSLAALVAAAPYPSGDPAGQVIHWLFALGDTLAANVFRTLAVLGTHPHHLTQVRAELAEVDLGAPSEVAALSYLAASLHDTMRLWPTTRMFGRVALTDVRFPYGKILASGSPLLIMNTFNHRNRARVAYADRFAPEEWIIGGASEDWQFNFFSHGPQGCPGAAVAVYLGQAVLAQLLRSRDPEVSGVTLGPDSSLPHSLDVYELSVALRQGDGGPRNGEGDGRGKGLRMQ